MYGYEYNGDHYYFVHDKEIIDIGEEVAILYDEIEPGKTVLLKHGRPDIVTSYFDEMRSIYKNNGLSDLASQIKLLIGRIPIEELNKMINTCDYIGRFLKNQGV